MLLFFGPLLLHIDAPWHCTQISYNFLNQVKWRSDDLITVEPVEGWDILGREWIVSSWCWCVGKSVRIWDISTGKKLWCLDGSRSCGVFLLHSGHYQQKNIWSNNRSITLQIQNTMLCMWLCNCRPFRHISNIESSGRQWPGWTVGCMSVAYLTTLFRRGLRNIASVGLGRPWIVHWA